MKLSIHDLRVAMDSGKGGSASYTLTFRQFPNKPYAWPTTGLRRASINSFGYGGANCHIVIDDAYNYLRMRNISGKHYTSPHPSTLTNMDAPLRHQLHGCGDIMKKSPCKLLPWSSSDKGGILRMIIQFQHWLKAREGFCMPETQSAFLEDLTYTLDTHRTRLPWRSFALIHSADDLLDLHSRISPPVRVLSKAPRLGFVFSGQGSQWYAMGRELMLYPSFSTELNESEYYLRSLGCNWSVKGK